MARLSLNCSCGWNFFVPGTTQGHQINCPSCGQAVRIPGRKPGQAGAQSAGDIALQIQRKQAAMKMMIGGGILAVVIIGVLLAITFGSSAPPPPPDAPVESEVKKNRPVIKEPPKETEKVPEIAAPVIEKISPEARTAKRAKIDEAAMYINLAKIVAECLRYRDYSVESHNLLIEIEKKDGDIKMIQKDLARYNEEYNPGPTLAIPDVIVGIQQTDLKGMTGAQAGLVLATFVKNWTPGDAVDSVRVLRNDLPLEIKVKFLSDTLEMRNLRDLQGVQVNVNSSVAPGQEAGPISADVFNDIEAGFKALPPGYRSLVPPEDAKRLKTLTDSKRGYPDDAGWLQTKIQVDLLSAFRRDAENIQSKVTQLEGNMLKDPPPPDTVTLKGQAYYGWVIENGEETIKLKQEVRFAQGKGSTIKEFKKADGPKVESKSSAPLQFRTKYASDKGDLPKLTLLLSWCIDRNLPLERDLVAYVILTLDASNEKARNTLKLSHPLDRKSGK